MEFLVEFEVNVPLGAAETEVAAREGAEASAAAKLAANGHIERIWKLPVGTILGLYRAETNVELDGIVTALPLYDWMQVTVTPLSAHPSDPGAEPTRPLAPEYLVTMTTHVPDGTSPAAVDEIRAREAAHSRQLAAEGHLLRLWRPPLQPGEWRTLGLFSAADAGQLEEVLASMPLRVWRTDEVTPLSPHPNDPTS